MGTVTCNTHGRASCDDGSEAGFDSDCDDPQLDRHEYNRDPRIPLPHTDSVVDHSNPATRTCCKETEKNLRNADSSEGSFLPPDRT